MRVQENSATAADNPASAGGNTWRGVCPFANLPGFRCLAQAARYLRSKVRPTNWLSSSKVFCFSSRLRTPASRASMRSSSVM